MSSEGPTPDPAQEPHRRRPRYAGKYPRRYEEKYKELNPDKFPETVAKVRDSGKTPAGMHVPIMVREIIEALRLRPGMRVVDCTLGYGGHAREILRRILPGGQLLGLDVDPIEQPKTEARLRAEGFDEETFLVRRSNFAGMARVLLETGWNQVGAVLADLGVSSMQLDTPSRGFSVKLDGPLDMRMNPGRGRSASEWLQHVSVSDLAEVLTENADEPHAEMLAELLAGKSFTRTVELSEAVRTALAREREDERDKAVRRTFQALRIAVNDEFGALDTWLRLLPSCLEPGARIAVLTFHSGEDRRVKKSFQENLRTSVYSAVAEEVIRAGADECRANPRASSAKLRWAEKAFDHV
jgi:16S rRNA (cytosine1402-N4)-methyltransferase